MICKFKKYDKIVSISDYGELKQYEIYTIKETYGFHNIDIEGLIWSYHIKNFISISEYRNLKLRKIKALEEDSI